MIRAFAALALPEAVRFDLMLLQQGLPLPRPVPPENLHLTLVFLGELPERRLDDIDLAFRAVRAPGFEMALAGLGLFGGAKPRVVYAGAAEKPGCAICRPRSRPRRAARASRCRRGGSCRTSRWRGCPSGGERGRLEQAVAARGGYAAARFAVEDFRLYRSHLAAGGATYEELARYPLA